MLKQIRGGLKSAGAWLGVALLVPAFALWGVPELRDFVQRPLLKVGKTDISTAQLQSEYTRAFERRREEAGGKFTPEEARAQKLGDQVVDGIATRTLLEIEAEKLGLVMPDSLVANYLKTNDAFKNPATGKFDETVLQNILRTNNLSVPEFERLIKKDLLRGQLVAGISAGGSAPAELSEGLLLREAEIRRVGYLTITEDMAGPAKSPTADELKAYYEGHGAEFQSPEYRTFTAILLRPEDFASGVEVPEDEMKRAYETNKARVFEQPEKRTLYQLTYDAEDAANAAVAALKGGKPFETVAKDKGMTLAAATLTEVRKKDILDPKVGEAVFAPDAAEGAIIGPVKGTFGWTVAQVAGIKAPETKSYEDARPEILKQYLAAETKKKVFDAVEALENARDTGAILADAAKKAGVTAKSFGPVDSFSFAPGGAIVPDIPGDVLKEAFQLAEGDESEAIQLDGGGYFFVQVDEVRPTAAIPFDEVKSEVEAKWRAEERRLRIEKAAETAMATIKSGKTLADVAAGMNRAALEVVIKRGGENPAFAPDFVEKIFAADKGAVLAGAAGSGDARTLAEVREVKFIRNQISAVEESSFRRMFGYQLNQEYVEAYIEALREDYGVKADKERLAQLFSETQ